MALVWEEARQQARDLRSQYGTGDPYELARLLGVEVYQSDMPDGSSGMIVKKAGEDAVIFIEASDTGARQRFTLAHELGHLIERTNVADDNEFSFRERRGMKYDLHEFFADEFAGELLMPEVEFIRRMDEGATNTALASEFGVSMGAVEQRRSRLMKHRAR